MESEKETLIGKTVKLMGNSYKVIEELKDHWLVIPNNGMWPQTPLIIPKEPTK